MLKEDDDLTIAVYDYWLNKRLRLQHSLIYQVKTEKRDGSTTNNPYVAFRRRTEKMQTRKYVHNFQFKYNVILINLYELMVSTYVYYVHRNRKNDEASYEKQLKLRRDVNRAL